MTSPPSRLRLNYWPIPRHQNFPNFALATCTYTHAQVVASGFFWVTVAFLWSPTKSDLWPLTSTWHFPSTWLPATSPANPGDGCDDQQPCSPSTSINYVTFCLHYSDAGLELQQVGDRVCTHEYTELLPSDWLLSYFCQQAIDAFNNNLEVHKNMTSATFQKVLKLR